MDPVKIPHCNIINIIEDGQYSKNFIELRGNVSISYSGKHYSIVTWIFFPISLPQMPPLIKIVNIDCKNILKKKKDFKSILNSLKDSNKMDQ